MRPWLRLLLFIRTSGAQTLTQWHAAVLGRLLSDWLDHFHFRVYLSRRRWRTLRTAWRYLYLVFTLQDLFHLTRFFIRIFNIINIESMGITLESYRSARHFKIWISKAILGEVVACQALRRGIISVRSTAGISSFIISSWGLGTLRMGNIHTDVSYKNRSRGCSDIRLICTVIQP